MTDHAIIELYFARDQRAITRTDEAYGRYFRTIAWNILRNHEDEEECVNDSYFDTWNAIPPARPFSLKAFVGRITRNKALNRYEQKNALKRGGGETAACLDELAECVSGEGDPASGDDYRHLVTCLDGFLSDLKKEQRIMFVRRYWYGCTVREIAEGMGLGESNVKVTLSRLRNRLKEYLEKEGVRV